MKRNGINLVDMCVFERDRTKMGMVIEKEATDFTKEEGGRIV